MRRIGFIFAGSVIALLSATAAQASVIYNWHSTSPGQYVTATGGELVVTNAAYRAGSINEIARRNDSPVISASLTFNDGVPGVFVNPRRPTADSDIRFTSQVTFNDDGTLSGYMFLLADSETEVAQAGGTRSSWGVFNYGSDYFSSEPCGPSTCSGGSGFWQLSRVEVPAPPAWPLFGLGVLALFGLRRKA